MENKQNLKKFIVEIAVAEKIELNCVILSTETKVNGFFGDIFRANIRGKRRSFNVFIKVVTKSDKIRAIAPVDEAYNNESMFYKDIFPAMKKLEAELKLQSFFNPVPRFYRDAEYGDQSFLAVEDLTRSNFRMFDLKEEIDEDHLMMISRLFGKFHALSFALKHLRPEIYKDLVNRLQCVQSGFLRYKGGFFKHCVCVIKEGLKKINSKNKIINYYVKNIERSYKNILVQSKKDKYTCIVHYDAWMNNLMFKYHVDSPVRDRNPHRNPKQHCGEELPLDPRVPPLYTDALTDDNNPDLIPPTNESLLDSSLTPFIISARPSSKRNCATQMPVKPYHVTWAPILQSRNCSTQTPPPHKESSV